MLYIYALVLVVLCLYKASAMPIDDYVWRKDDVYGWTELTEYYQGKPEYFGGEGYGFSGYLLNVTSQRWLTDADFSEDSEMKSLWWHYLVVIVPHKLEYTKNGTMWITGSK